MNPPAATPGRVGRVGVREVAQLAGVSTQTVSRVVNGSPNVRAATRERVQEAIVRLDYRPNNAARALGTAQTRTLGVVATDVTLYGPSLAIASLAGAARQAGRWLSTAYADADDEASVEAAVSHVLGQGVDGLVLVAPHTRTREALLARALDVPIVIMHGGLDRQSEGASLVVEHLVGLGHRSIGRLGGPPDWIEEASRRIGFEAALAAHGLASGPCWVGDWSARSGASIGAAVAATVRSKGGPTAVVAANDQMALGLMASLREQDVEVPGDVSVVGFDDTPDSAFYQPGLTTVRLDVAGEARRCVAAVFEGDGSEQPGPPVLVVRASTSARA